ncbi:hypothetical protein LTR56_014473 [Elasticomyces elasticus]|nr:hypothetical protein LTR56_014473 [Elasticomyces elasticus]KAK3646531.1 hypothetical protein LTR22_014294 [Elasticomyces elasticus]KAK4910442.1 hypothetical protein LTR49_020877 [Elasticomyces elasticus]KAK5755658.1 hypothetical protein LTS12_014219 [Elasticomyces elasticus]
MAQTNPILDMSDQTRPLATTRLELSTSTVDVNGTKSETIVTDMVVSPTDSTPSPSSPKISGEFGRLSKVKLLLERERHERSEPVWRPSLLKIRPLLGILSLAFSIGCMFLSLAILLVSHEQPVRHWPIQPTVYLAIASAIGNTALGFSRYHAVPIAWWYRASRGSTIKDLERNWEVGHSLVLALRHNIHMGFPGFATIVVALMIIDGPLLQRATTVDVVTSTKNATLALNLSPEVPNGFSGYGLYNTLNTSSSAISVSVDWKNRAPIHLDVQPCNGTCTAKAIGPGVALSNCSSQTWEISRADIYDPNATWGLWRAYDSLHDAWRLPMMYTLLGYLTPNLPQRSEVAKLQVGLLHWDDPEDENMPNGTYVESTCYYVPAILEYDLVVKGTEVTIPDHPDQGRVVQTANNSLSFSLDLPPDQVQPNTMDALSLYLNLFVNVNSSVLSATNPPPGQFWGLDPFPSSNTAQLAKYFDYTQIGGAIHLTDPTHDIVFALNELMFRAGVMSTNWTNLADLIDPGLSIKQTLQAEQTVTENVYRSDLRWFAGAAILEIIAVLFVLPLFWGWWTLDKVTLLSPFEVALAFDAPLLKEANSAQGVAAMVRSDMGKTQVKWGAVPDRSKFFDTDSDGTQRNGNAAYRLGIAESQSVMTPHKGMRFDM